MNKDQAIGSVYMDDMYFNQVTLMVSAAGCLLDWMTWYLLCNTYEQDVVIAMQTCKKTKLFYESSVNPEEVLCGIQWRAVSQETQLKMGHCDLNIKCAFFKILRIYFCVWRFNNVEKNNVSLWLKLESRTSVGNPFIEWELASD